MDTLGYEMSEKKPVCGIIMPISQSDDFHTEAHWEGIKSMLSRAVELAKCHPQPVWEKDGADIIQASILKNLFENDLALVDISTRNPNVMLEWGMRLTTKKPTIVVAEQGTPLPFDTGVIHTEFYDPTQQWASAEAFIEKLAKQIEGMLEAKSKGNYKPYLESFQFETVKPSTVSVSAEQRMESVLGDIVRRLTAIERRLPINVQQRIAGANDLAFWADQGERSASAIARGGRRDDPVHFPADPSLGFQPGDKVFHRTFGRGTVVGVDKNKVEVDFSSAGVRRVIDTFLQPHEI